MAKAKHILNNMKILRENAGLSIEEAIEKIGVAKSTLYGWENGSSKPDIGLAHIIAKHYKCTLEDIYPAPRNKRKKKPKPVSA